MRKAVVRKSDGYVENVIEWAEGANWQPPEGCYLVDALDGSPGDTWDGAKFIKMPPPPPSVDWQTEWDKASPTDKINVLARMLGIHVDGSSEEIHL